MQTRNIALTKNQFKASQRDGFEPYDESIVFISYKRDPDLPIAIRCTEKLQHVNGISYWIDQKDECLSSARASTNKAKKAVETAKCIEKGLDVASALLGIIGPETFDSPWVPYEIDGARGRQRFTITYTSLASFPHPLIAHLIYDVDDEDVPDFVALGTPLFCIDDMILWARSVAEILEEVEKSSNRQILSQDGRDIRRKHGVEEIHKRNITRLRYRSR